MYILDSNNIVPTILLKANLAENSTPPENNSTCNYIFGSLEILFWVNINESQTFYLATLDTNLRKQFPVKVSYSLKRQGLLFLTSRSTDEFQTRWIIREEILDLKNFKTKLPLHLISSVPWKVRCFRFQYRYIVEQQYFPWNVFVSRKRLCRISALKTQKF